MIQQKYTSKEKVSRASAFTRALKMVRGFTLIEFLIYFGILAILMVIIGGILFQVLSNRTKLETLGEINQSARTIIEQLTTRVHNAQGITAPAAGLAASNLSLVYTDAAKNPTTIDLSSGIVQVKEGSASTVPLNSNEVTVSNLSFTNISYPNTQGAIRIMFTLQSSSTGIGQEYSHTET